MRNALGCPQVQATPCPLYMYMHMRPGPWSSAAYAARLKKGNAARSALWAGSMSGSMLQPSLTQSLSFTDAATGLWPLGRGRNLQSSVDTTEEELCAFATWMKVRDPPTAHPPTTCCESPPTHQPTCDLLQEDEPTHSQVMYWALAGVWVAFFLVWAALVLSPGKRRRGLRLFLFVLPLIMFGNSIVHIDVHTTCPCLLKHCLLTHLSGTSALSTSLYTFHIGRLVVFPLSLYVIATGCGTIYAQVPTRGWLVIVFVFGGFATSLGCSFANIDPNVILVATAIATLLYVAVYLTILAEAVVSCKVLKAQLLMIREQRIDPRSCPAWAKFRLFTWLRRFVSVYLTVEAISIVLNVLQLPLFWSGLSTLMWELVQVCIAGALGWVFGGTTFNRFVESERHMLPSEITTLLAPSDMSLAWQVFVSKSETR